MNTRLSRLTSNQNAFAAALQEKVNETFSTKMGGEAVVMSNANGFYYYFQGGPNGFWNELPLRQIDSLVTTDPATGLLVFVPQSFSGLYASILQSTAYVISSADQAIINTDQQNASTTINAVISSWEASFGPITKDQMSSAVPPSKIGYIQGQVQSRWGGNITGAPSSLNSLKVAYQTYEVQAAKSFALLNRSNAAELERQVALGNTQKPTAANGALQIGAGDSDFFVNYTVPAQSLINGGLQTPDNKITISVTVESFKERTANGNIEGSTEFAIPVLDLFSVNVEGGASYDWSSELSSSSSMTMNVTWPGVTVVGVVPMALVGSKGWFDNQILAEVVTNTGKGTSVTGFQLQGQEFPINRTFGPGGRLAYLKAALISQLPTVSITFTQANVAAFESTFKEHSSVSVDLFGFIPLGSVSQSYEVQNIESNSEKGTVTITFGPPIVAGVTPDAQSSACLIAGVPSYPGEAAHVESTLVSGKKRNFYQCFKTVARAVYCSSSTFKSHAEGAAWVGQCMAAFGVTAADLLGRPYESDRQPSGATIW